MITSMTMDALDDIDMESLTAGAAAEKRIDLIEWDLKSTVTAAVWSGSARRRAWNAKMGWDRAGLRTNRFQWKGTPRHNSTTGQVRK